jgi:hypothetical protein
MESLATETDVNLLSPGSRTLERYQRVVGSLPGLALTENDIAEVQREFEKPVKAGDEVKIHWLENNRKNSNGRILEERESFSEKQLAMFNLFLAERFLVAHAAAGTGATLHSDDILERMLEVRLDWIRKAAGIEVGLILEAEGVELPVLSRSGPFPYRSLLSARETKGGREFRRVVEARDASGGKLLRSYMSSLDNRLADRLTVRVARFLASTIVGVLEPITGTVLSAADTFLVEGIRTKRTARYFISKTLPTITHQ